MLDMFAQIEKDANAFFAKAEGFIAREKKRQGIPRKIPVTCYTEELPGDAVIKNIKPLAFVDGQLYKVEMI